MSTRNGSGASDPHGAVVSRRIFVTHMAAASGFIAVAPALAMAARSPVPAGEHAPAAVCHAAPIVSFHLDQPYLDMSGQCMPYLPPTGCRSAQPLAELSDAEFYACSYGA